MVNALYKRLTARGYEDQNILHVFKEAAQKIELKDSAYFNVTHKNHTPLQTKDSRIFFHVQFHKRDFSRKYVRDAYETAYESLDNSGYSFKCNPTPEGTNFRISKLTIAYSRPKNLRDKLTPSTLFETESCNVKHIMNTIAPLHGQDP